MSASEGFAERLYAELSAMTVDQALKFLQAADWNEHELPIVVEWVISEINPEALRSRMARHRNADDNAS